MLHRHMEESAKEPPPSEPKRDEERRNVVRKRPGRRAALYVGTRNMYYHMVAASKSLLCNCDVDDVFFLVEDDDFPLEIPKEIHCINVSKQTLFSEDGPNYHNPWSYMCLMRAALTKLLPEYDRVLSLDDDTIVMEDISGLWDLDIGDYAAAMVNENRSTFHPFGGRKYYNAGVMLQNLDFLRETGLDDEIITALNTTDFTFNEQCAINKHCAGKIYELPANYNDNYICGETFRPLIVHYAGTTNWYHNEYLPYFSSIKEYRAMPWEEVSRIRQARYGLPLTLAV